MQYYLNEHIQIDTHNTAKSSKQASKYVVDYINKLSMKKHILDFGCGKLRYSLLLKNKCTYLTLVDSEKQIQRQQIIHGENTTLSVYIKTNFKNTRLLNYRSFAKDDSQYDFVFCANVLSAIPSETAIKEILQLIHDKLENDGKAIFITQYINSYYAKKKNDASIKKHLYGWLTLKNNKVSYYGLLDKELLVDILTQNGFQIIKSWRIEQSAYVLCMRGN